MQKLTGDAAIEAHAARDLLDIGAALLAQVRHFVDERDLGGKKSVGGTLDQLGSTAPGEQDRRLVDEQRPIELAHHPACPLVVGADHPPDRGA
jgi:hypothetical protein